jgi:hydrophobe/amphiphile efflux-3 (HAE3) family protein
MRDVLARIAGRAVERPTPVISGVVLLTLIGAIAALSLEPARSPDSLVDRRSDAYAATQSFYDQFGGEPVEVLVKGDVQELLLSDNLGRLLALESCLSGRAKGGEVIGGKPAPPACAAIAELDPSFAVFGPATYLNQFAIAARNQYAQQSRATLVEAQRAGRRAALLARRDGLSQVEQQQAALTAAQQVLGRFQQQLAALAVRYGQTGLPSIDDPRFVRAAICDTSRSGCVPKPQLAAIVPSPDAALISVRLRPGLSDSERHEAISLFREAVADPTFRLQGGRSSSEPSYVVSGVPVVFEGLAQELSTQIFVFLAAALAAMVIVLSVAFRTRLRLLPLGIALGATGLVFGFLALAGGSLTMASIAVLPVLIGLSVDYAIQFQARFAEALEHGSSPPRAAVEAAATGGPVIATAALATMAGFAVLVLSPIPMVRGFALLLVLGILVAFALALSVGLSSLSLLRARGSTRAPRRVGARERPEGPRSRLRAGGRRALAFSIASPGKVLVIAALLAIAGWGVGTRIQMISDIRELVPRDLPALEDVDALEQATGVSGLTYVTVNAPDISDPAVITWMHDFERRVLRRHGFRGQGASCRADQVELCPEISLSDFLYAGGQESPGQARIKAQLRLLPPYVSQALLATDRASGDTGLITFGIKVMPFDQQKELIDDIRRQIHPPGEGNDPPAGVNAQVVGLPVLAADANSALSENRYLVTVAGLLAVALVLLVAYRSASRAFVPLIPIVLATGWASLVLWVAGVPLNPMSATLGALVIAIATEFSVLLSARYHEERRRGGTIGEALRGAYARTGSAVFASGITAIAGFAVLVLTDIRMLRDFGLVTVFDLAVALAGVLLVLPAALVWSESRFEPLASLVSRLRRRGRPAPADAG